MKYDRLDDKEWGKHFNKSLLDGVVNSVKLNTITEQTKVMMNHTQKGDNILEVGPGSGETSLYLAKNERNISALDFSQDSLDLVSLCANELNLDLDLLFYDATNILPFEDNNFDIVFQAGLLEHFYKDERIKLLKEWGRVSKKMVSIIPNATSVPYRYGKYILEKNNKWTYGLELPQYTLKDEFREAGYRVTEEYTVGFEQSLAFLPRYHPLRIIYKLLFRDKNFINDWHQGYLLVTVGEKL